MRTRALHKIYFREQEEDIAAQTIQGIENNVQQKISAGAETEPADVGSPDAGAEAPTEGGPPAEAPADIEPAADVPVPPEPDEFTVQQLEYLNLLFRNKSEQYAAHLAKMRELDPSLLTPSRRRFIDDNLSVASMLLEASVADFSRKFKTKIKAAGSFSEAWDDVGSILESNRDLGEAFFKLGRLGAARADAARKLIAALASGAQIGSGGDGPDIIIPTEKNGKGVWLGIKAGVNWSNIEIARWQLSADDPGRYLDEVEAQRLENGSPEERAVIRKRLVVESVSAALSDYEVLIIVANPDGTWEELCFTPSTFIKDAFQQGTVTVIEIQDDGSGSSFTSDGKIASCVRFGFVFVETQPAPFSSPVEYLATEQAEPEPPSTDEPEPTPEAAPEEPQPIGTFIEQRGDRLVLSLPPGGAARLAEAASMFYASRTWTAPDDVSKLRAYYCVPDARDVLFKRC